MYVFTSEEPIGKNDAKFKAPHQRVDSIRYAEAGLVNFVELSILILSAGVK